MIVIYYYHYMDSKKTNKLGSKIKKLRTYLDLSQEKFSQKAKIPYTTFTKIESGVIKSPSVYVVSKIAKTLNTTVDNLIKQTT